MTGVVVRCCVHGGMWGGMWGACASRYSKASTALTAFRAAMSSYGSAWRAFSAACQAVIRCLTAPERRAPPSPRAARHSRRSCSWAVQSGKSRPIEAGDVVVAVAAPAAVAVAPAARMVEADRLGCVGAALLYAVAAGASWWCGSSRRLCVIITGRNALKYFVQKLESVDNKHEAANK